MKPPRFEQFVSGLLLLVVLPPLMAQPTPGTAPARHPMWRIAGDRATVYLLGSVHILKEEDYPLAPAIEAAFEKVSVVVFEVDFEEAEQPAMKTILTAKGRLETGRTLRDQVSANLYERLTNYLVVRKLPLEAVENLKPGVVALAIQYIEARRLGFDEKLGVDRHLQGRARKQGKQVIGLETPESQMEVVTGLSKKGGAAFLDDTLKNLPVMEQQLQRAMKAWKTGDIKIVADYLNETVAKYPELYQRFVLDRNRRWIPKIEALVHGSKDALVVVGAGHLAGKQSIIQMLEHNGLKATQE